MPEEGGDPACWLDRVCERCGAFIGDGPHICVFGDDGSSMASTPQVSIGLSHLERIVGGKCERLLELAQAVEAAGADQLAFSEHVTLTRVITDEPGSRDGSFPFPGDHPYPEPLITLAAVAAVTHRVRLSTNVLIAPLRPAVLLAKMAATLDCLSGGRLDLGVGTGWHREEFAALGVPLERRAARMDDTIRACRQLWRNQPASFTSPTVSFTDMYCSPSPLQRDLPIWFGGGANTAMALRVVELGNGWSPIGSTDPAQVRAGVALLRRECERTGRDPREIGVRVTIHVPPTDDHRARLDRYAQAVDAAVDSGATMVQISLAPLVRSIDEAEDVVRELLGTVKRARTRD